MTRRSLFATIGLLFANPRKLLANPCQHRHQDLTKLITKSAYKCLCGAVLDSQIVSIRVRAREDDFNRNGKKIGDIIQVRMPIRFRLEQLDRQIALEKEQDAAFLRGDRW